MRAPTERGGAARRYLSGGGAIARDQSICTGLAVSRTQSTGLETRSERVM